MNIVDCFSRSSDGSDGTYDELTALPVMELADTSDGTTVRPGSVLDMSVGSAAMPVYLLCFGGASDDFTVLLVFDSGTIEALESLALDMVDWSSESSVKYAITVFVQFEIISVTQLMALTAVSTRDLTVSVQKVDTWS